MIELVVRLAFSLAVVLGLVTLLARVSAKRFRGSTNAPIRVVHRQALSRGSAVAVVSVGSRVLVVGTTEQQVSLLTELDPSELDELTTGPTGPTASADAARAGADFDAELQAVLDEGLPRDATTPVVVSRPAGAHKRSPAARDAAPIRAVTASTVSPGVLAGSALSPQTWRQAFSVASRRQQDAS